MKLVWFFFLKWEINEFGYFVILLKIIEMGRGIGKVGGLSLDIFVCMGGNIVLFCFSR